MEVVFLGTGTSEGVPIIAQPEDFALDLENPKNWRTRTSIHVVMDGCAIQVDAAPEFRLQCIHNDIRQVDHFILTHEHADHIQGMDDLRRFCRLREGNALPVYSTRSGLERVQAIYPYAIKKKAKSNYPAFSLVLMPKKLEIDGSIIRSTLLPHGEFHVLGLVFEEKSTGKRLAYFTDCHEVTEEAQALARDADVLVIDALRHQPHRSHLTINQAVGIAKSINAQETYFVHMTCDVEHEIVNKALPEGVQLGYDGLRLVL